MEQLRYKPRPDDLSDFERNALETANPDWMESVTPEQRENSLFPAKLDLAEGWRWLEEHMLEDTDSEMLYQNGMDGFEDDVELNTQLGFWPNRSQGLVRAIQRLPRSGLRALITNVRPDDTAGAVLRSAATALTA